MIYFYCPSFLSFGPQSSQALPEPLESFISSKNEEGSLQQKNIFSPTILLCPSSHQQIQTMESLPKFKNQNLFLNDKNQTKDGDYTPENKGSKRNRNSKQLQNRNVVPNIVRLILSFVQKKGKSEKLVEQLLKKNGHSQASLQRFFNFHKLIKNSMNNYVHVKTLAQLIRVYPEHLFVYGIEEQNCYSQITRKLVLHFLRNQANLCVITSKRMDKIKKRDHLTAIKMMTEKIQTILMH